MNFVVAIPSYLRQEKLKAQTLHFLASESIPPDSIYIFVASEEQKALYLQTLDPSTYGTLVVGVPTLSRQKNFIYSYFPEGQQILFIDDDIKGLKWIHPRPLLSFVQQMFQIAQEENVALWSIQPATTVLYCKERISIGKMFCVGCFCGVINKKDCTMPDISACEDKWLSLFRWKTDGATMRYDGCCPNTIYFAKGGLTDYRKTRQHLDTQEVVAAFPEDCILTTKKSGVSECSWRQTRLRERQLPPL